MGWSKKIKQFFSASSEQEKKYTKEELEKLVPEKLEEINNKLEKATEFLHGNHIFREIDYPRDHYLYSDPTDFPFEMRAANIKKYFESLGLDLEKDYQDVKKYIGDSHLLYAEVMLSVRETDAIFCVRRKDFLSMAEKWEKLRRFLARGGVPRNEREMAWLKDICSYLYEKERKYAQYNHSAGLKALEQTMEKLGISLGRNLQERHALVEKKKRELVEFYNVEDVIAYVHGNLILRDISPVDPRNQYLRNDLTDYYLEERKKEIASQFNSVLEIMEEDYKKETNSKIRAEIVYQYNDVADTSEELQSLAENWEKLRRFVAKKGVPATEKEKAWVEGICRKVYEAELPYAKYNGGSGLRELGKMAAKLGISLESNRKEYWEQAKRKRSGEAAKINRQRKVVEMDR